MSASSVVEDSGYAENRRRLCGEVTAVGVECGSICGLVRRFPDALTPEPHPAANFDRGNASW
jgi:hypothetical protein